jgi:ATP/maltotriose-dependent transcriptional regulator MalT
VSIPLLERAATTAHAATAVDLIDAALTLAPDEFDSTALLAAKARTLAAMGRPDDAEAVASRLPPTVPDLAARLRLHTAEVMGRLTRGQDPEPVAPADAFVEQTGAGERDDPEAVLALIEYALLQLIAGHHADAEATLALVADRAEPSGFATAADGDVAAILADTARAATSMFDGCIDEAVSAADRVVARMAATDVHSRVAGFVPLAGCAAVLSRAGRHDDALQALASARQLLRAFGLSWIESLCDANGAMILVDAGRWDAALDMIDAGLAGSDAVGQLAFQPWLLALRALVATRRGDLDAAATDLARAERSHSVVFGGLDHLLWARATLAGAQGDAKRSRAVLDELVDRVLATGAPRVPAPMGTDAIRAHLAAGRQDRAEELAALIPDGHTTVIRAQAAAAHALCRQDAADLADAAAIVSTYLPYEGAHLWEDAARAARERGEAWADAARRADRAYQSLGATTDRARLATAFADAAVFDGPSSVTPLLDELTRTERRVTQLVVEGLSNAEIAATLSVSPRTVESHLSRIYAKLGIRSRLQLAALATGAGAARSGGR